MPYSKLKEFLEHLTIHRDVALDHIIYGIEAKKALIRGRKTDIILIESISFPSELNIIDKKTGLSELLEIRSIIDISFGNRRGNFLKNKISCSNIKTKFKNSNCISLLKSKGESLDLYFSSEYLLNNFVLAIVILLERIFEEEEDKSNLFFKPIKKLWNLYDTDLSKKLEFPEFFKMIKQMNINNSMYSLNLTEENSIKQIFDRIDNDNSGKIDYDEFIIFYNKLICGEEFSEIFNKYSNGKDFLNLEDFSDFMKNEQKQNLKIQEIKEIMLEYKTESLDVSFKTFDKNDIR